MIAAMKTAPDVVTEEFIDVACALMADLLKQYLNEPSSENRGECDEQVGYMAGLIDDIFYNANNND
jgi:hypothetical protein